MRLARRSPSAEPAPDLLAGVREPVAGFFAVFSRSVGGSDFSANRNDSGVTSQA